MPDPIYPAISANTLFHFTNRLENLLGILTNEFCPRFCLEDFNFLQKKDAERDDVLEWAVPMVCFCDLPLSQLGFHLSVYGDYGIGMSKEWGMKKGISPILYVYQESLFVLQIGNLMAHAVAKKDDSDLSEKMVENIHGLTSFIKPYEGPFWRPSGTLPKVRFYNEREWRFVPQLQGNSFMEKNDFLDAEKLREENTKIAKAKISFEPNDIRYLIVRTEAEIVPLVNRIREIKGRYSYDDVSLLSSRVISAEQIRFDF